MRVLVTGATGFVGRRLCSELAQQGYRVRAAVRDPARAVDIPVEIVPIGRMDGQTRWSHAVEGVKTIIHLAARVHVMRETARDAAAEFHAVNVAATRALAQAAVASQVTRLVYVSSIKVNGESTGSTPFSAEDAPRPRDAYAISKWEAERVLWEIAGAGLEVSVVRPPLVYGPGVGGNFLRLLKLISRGIPLPFGAVHNRRSMIYNGNLVHALIACARHPSAAGKTYLVSDGEDLSTPKLVRRIAAALRTRPRLLPVPLGILQLAGAVTGKAAEIDRLVESLQVDSSLMRSELAWGPPFSVEEGIAETARWFAGRKS